MKNRLRLLTIIIGCLLAVVIVWSQVYSSHIKSLTHSEQTDKNNTGEESDSTTISMASFSLPSPVSLQINLDPRCLFEIVFDTVTEETPQVAVPSIEEKLFVTLFRVIISPNAP